MKNILYSVVCILLFSLVSCEGDPKMPASTWKRTGNEVVIRLNSNLSKLNPATAHLSNEKDVINQIFCFLIDQDQYDFTYLPMLIKEMPGREDIISGPNKGGEVLRFEIREEAVWDDGKPVTGHDFVFSVKAVSIPGVPAERIRPYLTSITDIEVNEDNPKQFIIYTSRKDVEGVEAIGGVFGVMPKHLYDKDGLLDHIPAKAFFDKDKIGTLEDTDEKLKTFVAEFLNIKYARNPEFISGCGPYKLISWEEGKKIVLEKKKNWWGAKFATTNSIFSAGPDRLIYRPIVDNITAAAALRSEEIDVDQSMAPKDFIEMRADDKYNNIYNFDTPPFFGYFYLSLNTRKSKLGDKRVRQALAYAVNSKQIIDVLFDGLAEPMATPILPSSKLYNKDLSLYTLDIAKAKKILKEAGWEDSNDNGIVDKEIDGVLTELELDLLYVAGSSRYRKLVILCEETAKSAGIKIIPVGAESSILRQNMQKGDFDIAISGRNWNPTAWHPKQNWHTSGDGYTGFGTVESDALIDEITVELDDNKRTVLIKQLQTIIHEECPEIYLLTPVSRIVVHKRFGWKSSGIPPGFFPNQFVFKGTKE